MSSTKFEIIKNVSKDALMDISSICKEREWVSSPGSYFSGLMPYIQVGKLSVTAK